MSFDQLNQTGIVVFPKLLNFKHLQVLREAVSKLAATYEDWVVHHASPSGYFVSCSPLVAIKSGRRYHMENVLTSLLNPLSSEWCRRALGRGWFTERIVLDAKHVGPHPLTAWHADQFPHHGRCIKTMLYLTDTTVKNGAFSYVPYSHTWVRSLSQNVADNRTMHTYEELMSVPYHPSSFRAGIRQHIESSYESDNHYSITAPAGTLIVFDANGLHRGGTVTEGERWLIRAHHRNMDWQQVCTSKVALGTTLQRLWWRSP